jgi:hypothetical protein
MSLGLIKAPAVTVLDVMSDQRLLGRHFRDEAIWRAWRVFLAALFGLPIAAGDLELYQQCTGRSSPPDAPSSQATLIIGRRGGKSRVLALTAVFLACFRDWRPYLAPGERGYVVVVAADRRQARVIMNYVRAFLTETPMLAKMITKENVEDIELKNQVGIEVATCSYRTIRGRTVIAGLCDEAAFWSDESSANPDVEVLAALRPAMATVPGSMLLVASSPYARRGILWDAFRRHFGKAGAPLLWKAATRTMNPTVPESVIKEAFENDPASAAAEYGADFRTDVDAFVAREIVDAAVVPDRHELPPVSTNAYLAFVDPSGGSADAMTLAVAHADGDRGVLDAVRERRPPFSPDDVCAEFAALLKSYGVSEVCGDRYAGEWPRERFRTHGIEYVPAEKPKSDIYRDLLPILNAHRAELLDAPRLVAQLCGLERRTARGGRDSIDHGPGGHDDVANAVAGVLVRTVGEHAGMEVWRRLGMPHALPTAAPQPTEVAVRDVITGAVRYVPVASLRPAHKEETTDASPR